MKLEEDFRKEVEEKKISIASAKADTKYAVVQDMLLNAERCAGRGRYDDATARLYRALEALAQLRLFSKYRIRTSDVDINKIPYCSRKGYETKGKDGKIKLGLVEDYELLFKLEDPIGEVFKRKESDLREVLERRNRSILAHGFKSIKEGEYKDIKEATEKFIKECLKEILGEGYTEPRQLPHSLEEIERYLI